MKQNLSHSRDIQSRGRVRLAANFIQTCHLVSLLHAYSKFLHSVFCNAADCENEKK
jgi:hypothetical protein